MTSSILSLWYAMLLSVSPPAAPNLVPTVAYVETDGWHYVVRKDHHYFVIQSAAPDQFKVGDRLKTLNDRYGEQWVLINDTPRRTSVWVNGFWLSFEDARLLSAEQALQLVARTE